MEQQLGPLFPDIKIGHTYTLLTGPPQLKGRQATVTLLYPNMPPSLRRNGWCLDHYFDEPHAEVTVAYVTQPPRFVTVHVLWLSNAHIRPTHYYYRNNSSMGLHYGPEENWVRVISVQGVLAEVEAPPPPQYLSKNYQISAPLRQAARHQEGHVTKVHMRTLLADLGPTLPDMIWVTEERLLELRGGQTP